jgi:hypothetical protein
MTEADREQFTEAMQALCAVYGVEATLPLLTGYWMGLQDLPLQKVQEAVFAALREGGKFMPKPGEMRKSAAPKKLAAPYHAYWQGFEWQKKLEDRQDNGFAGMIEGLKPDDDE